MASRDYFKGKRIAVIGAGPHGEMAADIKYLIKAGAVVSLYDLRSEARLKAQVLALRDAGLVGYVCGSIPGEDLLDMDLIILSPEYPRDSSFLRPAREKGIEIEYAETLFFKLAPPLTVVGVMGPCGKATIVSMLAPMLEEVCATHEGQGFFSIDPESSGGVLTHLKKIKNGDILLIRIPEPMMKELYAVRMSPHVAIFTGVPSPMGYDKLPFEILSYQTYNNFIIASDEVIDSIRAGGLPARAKMLRTKTSLLPSDWPFDGRGPHDRENAALALQAARLFTVSDDLARTVLEEWKPLKGRLELIKKVKGIEFYNDSASVTSCSTEAAVDVLSEKGNLVLVFGGAETACDYAGLYRELPERAHTVVLLPGSGTLKERRLLVDLPQVNVLSAPSIEEAARMALEAARKGDRVLFSPGFEAGGSDRSRKERGERFVRAVRTL